MTTIITIRPELGSAATVRNGLQKDLDIASFALSEIQPVAWDAPDVDDFDGLLIGSANAILFGGEQLQLFQSKPVYAVGLATADAARKAGFQVRLAGQGGLQGLVSKLPGDTPLRLLRIAGREHVAINLPANVQVETRVGYEANSLPMTARLVELLRSDALVLLHSAGSAQHFRSECERVGLDLGQISIAALGPRIAAAAGSGWRDIRSAPQPREAALLALAADMCH